MYLFIFLSKKKSIYLFYLQTTPCYYCKSLAITIQNSVAKFGFVLFVNLRLFHSNIILFSSHFFSPISSEKESNITVLSLPLSKACLSKESSYYYYFLFFFAILNFDDIIHFLQLYIFAIKPFCFNFIRF